MRSAITSRREAPPAVDHHRTAFINRQTRAAAGLLLAFLAFVHAGRRFLMVVFAAALATCVALALAVSPLAGASQATSRLRVGWGAAMTFGATSECGIGSIFRQPCGTAVYVRPESTRRAIARTSIAGTAIRVRLSNRFGDAPITFSDVSIGIRSPDPAGSRSGGARLISGSNKPLTFAGGDELTIAPGQAAYTDLVPFRVRAQQDIAVSTYVKSASPSTLHVFNAPTALYWGQTQYVALGNRADDESGLGFEEAGTQGSGFAFKTDVVWLDAIELTSSASGAVVAIGDSITDGFPGGPPVPPFEFGGGVADYSDLFSRYTDLLSERLTNRYGAEAPAVVNEGVGGSDVPAAAARLPTDVFQHAGVTHVIVELGANDLAFATPQRTGCEVIDELERLVRVLHQHGLRVYGATLLPAGGVPSFTPTVEQYRQQVNDFIRRSGAFDAVLDFDAVLRDPSDPTRLKPKYDSGDHGHPSPAGQAALANSIKLSLFGADSGGKLANSKDWQCPSISAP